MSNDQIWEELSKVYNMPDVPDKAKEIIGNLMLSLDDETLIVSPLTKKRKQKNSVTVEAVIPCHFAESEAYGRMI